MTAAIVVMNSGAVALAADSATTIPYGGGTKHFQGATKLSGLHASEPVAVLWYGDPAYLGIPWEVLVKAFRAEVKTKRPTVAAYADAFLKYVDEYAAGEGVTSGSDPPASELVRELFKMVVRALERSTSDKAGVVNAAVDSWRDSLRPSRKIVKDEALDECTELLHWLEQELKAVTELVDGLPDAAIDSLRSAARSGWARLSAREPLHTGLVFAGFGTKQRFPAMCSYLVGVPLETTTRRFPGDPVAVSSSVPAAIVPFAENNQVKVFMEGLHPDVRRWFGATLTELEKKGRMSAGDVGYLKARLADHINQHGRPVVDAVRFLPKADLAEFARALIAFTAFRLRMSMAAETVGGPIDVAVVSRAEGLVWIHRTHYFSADLNPQFFSRY